MAKQYQFHAELSKYPASAVQARSLGEMYYYTGKPCRNGHLSLKYASSGNCAKCIEERRGTVEINLRGKSSKRSEENQRLAEQALACGMTTYKPSSPCKHGHLERYVGTNNCVACNDIAQIKRRQSSRWSRIKKEYGLTRECYAQMLHGQRSLCAICSTELNDKNTHIDHCHATGKVRALLCSRCNQAIGLLDESEERLTAAVEYIRGHNAATS